MVNSILYEDYKNRISITSIRIKANWHVTKKLPYVIENLQIYCNNIFVCFSHQRMTVTSGSYATHSLSHSFIHMGVHSKHFISSSTTSTTYVTWNHIEYGNNVLLLVHMCKSEGGAITWWTPSR